MSQHSVQSKLDEFMDKASTFVHTGKSTNSKSSPDIPLWKNEQLNGEGWTRDVNNAFKIEFGPQQTVITYNTVVFIIFILVY